MRDTTAESDEAYQTHFRAVGQDDLNHRADLVAAVAAEHADAVDRDVRFPKEMLAAAKQQRLLGMQVPVEVGGDGASVVDAVDVCYTLGKACSSSALIFAMHQIMVRILVRHGRGSDYHDELLRRIAKEGLLLANSTTENQTGGDTRASTCAVELDGERFSLTKGATVMSYGEQAHGILTTARRAPDSQPSDQVLVAFHKDDYELERIVEWDALGMRGTCSAGYNLRGTGIPGQILPVPYDTIHIETMLPVAHLTWSGVWTGIAAGAVERAQKFVQHAARSSGQMPPGSAHMTRAVVSLQALRGSVASAARRYEAAAVEGSELSSLDFQTSLNLLKVCTSEMATSTVLSALQACGLSGYRNDGEFSISRALRDVLSSSIMINNDRILASVANALLLVDVPSRLRD